jgi:flagellar biosynthesis/type III secretory pathway M-ring protein FliF/YscJ
MALVSLKGLLLLDSDIEDFDKHAVSSSGKVIEIQKRKMSGAEDRYYSDPVVEFITNTGDTVTFIDKSGIDINVKVGQNVKIKYMPDDPENAKIDIKLEESDQVYIIMMAAFAGLFFLVAIIFGFGLRKFLKKNS